MTPFQVLPSAGPMRQTQLGARIILTIILGLFRLVITRTCPARMRLR